MAIFGDKDLRKEWFQIESEDRRQLCRSIGVLSRRTSIPEESMGRVKTEDAITLSKILLDNVKLKDLAFQKNVKIKGVDPTFLFGNQPVLAPSTAFLVAPDVIATAAHCIIEQEGPGSHAYRFVKDITQWVFTLDYWYQKPEQLHVPSQEIYHVKEILFHTVKQNIGPAGVWRGLDDLAFLRLTKAPKDRPLLTLSEALPLPGSSVWAAGYSHGVPLKYKEGERMQVFEQDKGLTVSCAITNFPGDSGSPLFNARNEVVGVITSIFPEKDCDNGFTVSNEGWIKPVFRPLKPDKYDLMTWAYRLDCARWLINNKAKVIAECLFILPPEQKTPASILTISSGNQEAKEILVPDLDEESINVNCGNLVKNLPFGILDLKEIKFSMLADSRYDDKPVQWLSSIDFIVSDPESNQKCAVGVSVSNGPEVEVINKKVYTYELRKMLPDQLTVVNSVLS